MVFPDPTISQLAESSVLLDILLYYTPQFRERIIRAVAKEMNRIYSLFLQRNPAFTGRVSLMGHSLGSAICFDILCRQPFSPSTISSSSVRQLNLDPRVALQFDVHASFAVGSPVGLFQMLKGRNIAPRSVMERRPVVTTPLGEEVAEFIETGEVPVSCPKVYAAGRWGANFSVTICIICGVFFVGSGTNIDFIRMIQLRTVSSR